MLDERTRLWFMVQLILLRIHAETARSRLQREEGREETDWAVCEARLELCARLTEELARLTYCWARARSTSSAGSS